MGHVTREAWASQRKDMRDPIDFRTVIQWRGHFALVRVADISNSGMRLIGESLPNEGDGVRVGARNLDGHAIVMWRTDHGGGIMMRQRIDALRIVRANCRPGIVQLRDDRPLAMIRRSELADRLADMFADSGRARAFLHGAERRRG